MNRVARRLLLKDQVLFTDIQKIIVQYIPSLQEWFAKLKDTRHQSYIDYTMDVVMMTRLIGAVCCLNSMREMTDTLNTDVCISNLTNILNIKLDEIPHYDTINNVFCNIDIEELRNIQKGIVNTLIRSKMFDRYRYKGYFQIIFDGTGLGSFKEKPCAHALKKKHKDKNGNITSTTYHYSVLEAKLVAGSIVISFDTEFIENEDENVTKQDCEIKAFKRMADRIKRNHPKLPIIISGDSLYACGSVMNICKQNGWQYILTFKNGSIPTVGYEFDKLRKSANESSRNDYIFVNDIDYIASDNKQHYLNILEQYETQKNGETVTYKWICSFRITNENAVELAKIGRNRWKIENEGFNAQKNWYFNIEHQYSKNYNAMKVHYFIINIAHVLRQLLEKGILNRLGVKLTIEKVSELLTQSLTLQKLDLSSLVERIQLRFN